MTVVGFSQGITLDMIQVPGGTFTMGSPDSEPSRSSDEGPQHQVTVAEFWMGKYSVTQAQWRAVASLLPRVYLELNPDLAEFKGDHRPVERVTWYEAMEFCHRLSRHTGKLYRLPSEAEWEYACRAGTTTPFYCGDTITPDLANYDGNYSYDSGPEGTYREQTTPVGGFAPNGFGLYDMHGNVWEWCRDHRHDSYDGAPRDGSAWMTDGDDRLRMVRGGSWYDYPWFCRCAFRDSLNPDFRSQYIGGRYIGFRVVSAAR